MKKLIYICHLPLTEGLQKLFFMDHLARNGVDVAYWDVSALYNKKASRAGEAARPYVRKFKTLAELEAALDPAGDALFVPVVFYGLKVLSLFRLLTKRGAALCQFVIGLQPVPPGSVSQKVFRNLDYLVSPKKLAAFVDNRVAGLARRLGLVKGFDVVFAAGDVAASLHAGGRTVRINHCDYDAVLEHGGQDERLIDGRYAVFLDDNMPYHPDLKLVGLRPIAAGPYYRALNAYFAALERKHGARIVVAAHPKSDYRDNPFQGRPIFKGKTRELAAHCEFALTTVSSSASFAVLYEKPLLFFSTPEIDERYGPIKHGVFARFNAELLGRPFSLLGKKETLEIPPVDARRYAAYKYGYLTTKESESRLSKDICLDFFKRAEVAA